MTGAIGGALQGSAQVVAASAAFIEIPVLLASVWELPAGHPERHQYVSQIRNAIEEFAGALYGVLGQVGLGSFSSALNVKGIRGLLNRTRAEVIEGLTILADIPVQISLSEIADAATEALLGEDF